MMMLLYLFMLLLVAFLVLLERKILGLSQNRKGPNIISFFSLLQTILDGVKLILKNFILMKKNEFMLFIFSPMMSFFLALLNYYFICMFFSKSNMNYNLLFNLFISSLLVFTIMGSSWGSSNTYSLISSLRAVAQMISYEVVLSFFLLILLLKFNSFSWIGFLNLNFNFFSFFMVYFFLSLVIFSAELNRTPFDLVESESELVGGFNVEFSSIGFTFLFLSEYLSIWFYSFIFVVLMLNIKLIYIMSYFFVCLFIWFRAMLPRYKFLDLILLMWKVILPVMIFLYMVFLLF